MIRLLSYFWPGAPRVFVYMLQQVEYDPKRFLKWLLRLPDLRQVETRQRLTLTKKAKLMLGAAYGSWLLAVGLGFLFVVSGAWPGLLLILFAPVVSIATLSLITAAAWRLIVNPARNKAVKTARAKLDKINATRIAVIGSYGKTSMKHALATVLSEGRRVRATPGNQNVLISQARWVNQALDGNEEVLIFEFGEARPGDIARMADFCHPDTVVVTGLTPAHMEAYDSLDAVAADFANAWRRASADVYFNAESPELARRIKGHLPYSIDGVNGWRVSAVQASMEGTAFSLKRGKLNLKLRTGLIGRHQIGPLCAVVDIADRLGLTAEQIKTGVGRITPYEHRLQPYQLGGAWIIDDTYNGNIEGARAGLRFLNELAVQGRKIYVTPGFVEQGKLKQSVHEQLGQMIAEARPNIVVLMKNSTTLFIQAGLDRGGYDGELIIESRPLDFYTRLEHFVAAGDVVLMQNDWTDSYA